MSKWDRGSNDVIFLKDSMTPDLEELSLMTDDQSPQSKPPISEPVIQTVNLTKRFSSVVANDQISFDVQQGEIHCLLGENGAGKTTLAECLFGYYSPDSGQILFKGKPVTFTSPRDAIRLGIGMVHQKFVLIRAFTVLENILLSASPPGAMLDVKKLEGEIQTLCDSYQLCLDLNAEVWRLSLGEQQWIEILKAIYLNVDLLILDEPTAVLTPKEAEALFDFLRKMKEKGVSILLITHKLEEVVRLADRVTVLRKGKLVETVSSAEMSKADLARMMIGRDVLFQVAKTGYKPGAKILEVEQLKVKNDRGLDALMDFSFSLHSHEILGIAGVSGNGQKELFEALIGVRKTESGNIRYEGKEISGIPTNEVMKLGIGRVPEDRLLEGLILEFTVAENLFLGRQRTAPYRNGLFLDQKQVLQSANRLISNYGIATPSSGQKTKFLSGGNLQKVILARELDRNPKCLLVNQPTRGLDIGVVEYVHDQLVKLRDEGAGILLISEDLDELCRLADRLLVIFKGQVMGSFLAGEVENEQIGMLMAGIRVEVLKPNEV